jgi:hypothetical protein
MSQRRLSAQTVHHYPGMVHGAQQGGALCWEHRTVPARRPRRSTCSRVASSGAWAAMRSNSGRGSTSSSAGASARARKERGRCRKKSSSPTIELAVYWNSLQQCRTHVSWAARRIDGFHVAKASEQQAKDHT